MHHAMIDLRRRPSFKAFVSSGASPPPARVYTAGVVTSRVTDASAESSRSPRVELYTGADAFDSLRERWQELVRLSSNATPFQTYEWMSVWWQQFGPGALRVGKRPELLAMFEGRDLIGLFPMVRGFGPWRTLRPMGIGVSDYLHPLAIDGREGEVMSAVDRHLRERTDIDLIDLHQVRSDRAEFEPRAAGHRVSQATCLVLELPSNFDEYLARLGKSLRYDVRKLDKSLFREGRARIEHVAPEDTQRGLDVLFDLHRARWRARHLPGAFLGGATSFHRRWAELAQREGWLKLSLLHVDGKSIGAIYAMSLGATTYYYQAGFDPHQGNVSPGTLLVGDSIRNAIEEGQTHFDFLRGDEGYKRRWMPHQELRNFRTISPAHGALGRIGSKWNSMGFSVESRLRERLEGRGLI